MDSEQTRLSLSRIILRALLSLRNPATDRSFQVYRIGVQYIANTIFGVASSPSVSSDSTLAREVCPVENLHHATLSSSTTRRLSASQTRLLVQMLDTTDDVFQVERYMHRNMLTPPPSSPPDWLVFDVLRSQIVSAQLSAQSIHQPFDFSVSVPVSDCRFPPDATVQTIVSLLRPNLLLAPQY